jgi:hypothetical protein
LQQECKLKKTNLIAASRSQTFDTTEETKKLTNKTWKRKRSKSCTEANIFKHYQFWPMFAPDKKPKNAVQEYHWDCQKDQCHLHFHHGRFGQESFSTHLQ